MFMGGLMTHLMQYLQGWRKLVSIRNIYRDRGGVFQDKGEILIYRPREDPG
jgi:hypothetical protein